jgi:amino acid transporter
VLAVIAVLATVSGQFVIHAVVARTGRPSLLVMVLAVMVCGATALGFYVMVASFVAAAAEGPGAFALRNLCRAGGGGRA